MERHTIRRLIIDASVLIKWWVDEPNSSDARALRDAFLDGDVELIAPDLAQYEVTNALACVPSLSTADVELAIHQLLHFGIDFVPIDEHLLVASVELSRESKLAIYDAVYAALATRRAAILITADRKLLQSYPHARALTVIG